MVKEFFQKIYLKKEFSKYLNKETVEKTLNNNSELEKPKEKECGYIVFDIKQDDHFNETLSKIIDYAFRNENFLNFIYGSIIMFTISKILLNENIDIKINESLNEFIENIPTDSRQKIRGIYGIDTAKIGNFGTNNRMSYMVLLNNYFNKIVKLNEIDYGEIIRT
jgi:hypothetical protein